MNEETLRKASEDTKSVIALVTAVASVLSVVIVQLLNGFSYFWY